MAFTEQNKADAYLFFVLAFNAAPGAVYGGQIVQAYESGMTTADVVAQYVTKDAFLAQYPATQTDFEFASTLVNNVSSASTSATVKASAVADIQTALAAGWTKAQVITQILGNLANKTVADADWGTTVAQLNNKIAVAKVLTEGDKALSTTDVDTLKAPLENVTEDVSTVATGIAIGSSLSAKIEALTAAQKAEADYAEGLGLEDSSGNPIVAVAAVKADLTTTQGTEAAKFGITVGTDSEAVQKQKIDAKQLEATTAVTVKTSALQAAQADVNAVVGLNAAIVKKDQTAEAKTAADKAAALAEVEVTNQTNIYNVGKAADKQVSLVSGDYVLDAAGTPVVVIEQASVGAKWTFASGLTDAQKTGLTALLDSLNADLAADKAASDAATAASTAAADPLLASNSTKVSALATAKAELKTATDAQKALATAATDYQEATAALKQLETLGDSITAAEKAFTDAGQAVPADLQLTNAGTGADDIYLVGKSLAAVDATLAAGKDVIYVGKGYELNATADLTKGSNSALEVFFKETSTGTDVYVELKAFGSNVANASAGVAGDIVKITLTGVAADKVALKDGFITVAA
ncbi:hypothetical protein [Comamonas aquatica]|uniref:DUF4214 domain-containing protein n=1 Tax=Comamonas aquatica TaxID=225991 RepID=A0AA35D9C8_9BURK|nr:hypothetical protein [Comamonas aquatica]CAB5701295.1 Uncharacterised protein [Comamonas aquatica]CAC9689752.1 Uncharacterised protein [Comamonas aquatica]